MHWTEIGRRSSEGVVVLDLHGQMTLSDDEDLRLLHQIRCVLDEGHRHIVLNLASVAYIDSTGVGEIVGAYTRVVRAGGMLKLCCVSARTEELLRAASIDSVVEWFTTESTAVQSF